MGRDRFPLFTRCGHVALGLLAALPACGDDNDGCSDEIEAAGAFLEANRACEVDADCVVVHTGCHTYERGKCGQATLARTAAESAQWAELQDDLVSCDDECSRCLAALIPSCTDGFCGGP